MSYHPHGTGGGGRHIGGGGGGGGAGSTVASMPPNSFAAGGGSSNRNTNEDVSVLTDTNSYTARSAAMGGSSAYSTVPGGGGGGGGSGSVGPGASTAYTGRYHQPGGGVPGGQQPYRPQPSSSPHHHHHPQQTNKQQRQEREIENQNKLLNKSFQRIKQESYYLKRAIESSIINSDTDVSAIESILSNVLDRSVTMLMELSTSDLTPKNYYELFMKVLDEMTIIEDFFSSIPLDSQSKVTCSTLYEIVQYCPKVLPRIYLLIASGSALIKSKEKVAKEVLMELLDGVKGVQCPLRGLFLRHYLSQATRDKLPDVSVGDASSSSPSEYGEDVSTSYEFILTNFIETNKLWCRIQHMHASTKELRKKREKERNELRILVGTNLIRLSQLDGITPQTYQTFILPRILAEILDCKDTLAQAYLMDCIIQVFPDEFHLVTLKELLDVCPKLREKVNVRNIIQGVMDRLCKYNPNNSSSTNSNAVNDDNKDVNVVTDEEEEEEEGDLTTISTTMSNSTKKQQQQQQQQQTPILIPSDAFEMFDNCIQGIASARNDKGTGAKHKLKEVVRLQSALLLFAMNCYGYGGYVGGGRAVVRTTEGGNGGGGGGGGGATAGPTTTTTTTRFINRCLEMCTDSIDREGGRNKNTGLVDEDVAEELEKMLSIPLQQHEHQQQPQQQQQQQQSSSSSSASSTDDVVDVVGFVLELDRYSDLLTLLPWNYRKKVAMEMLRLVCGRKKKGNNKDGGGGGSVSSSSSSSVSNALSDVGKVGKLLDILSPLLRDHEASSSSITSHNNNNNSSSSSFDELSEKEEEEEERYEQYLLISQLIRMITCNNSSIDDTDITFRLISLIRKHLLSCSNKVRLKQYMISLVYVTLPLVHKVREHEFPPPKPLPPLPPKEQDEEETEDKEEEEEDGSKDGKKKKDDDGSGSSGEGGETTKESGEKGEDGDGGGVVVAGADTAETDAKGGGGGGGEAVEDETEGIQMPKTTQDEQQQQQKQEPLFADDVKQSLFGDDVDDANNDDDVLSNTWEGGGGRRGGGASSTTSASTKKSTFVKVVNCKKVFLLLQKMVSSIASYYPEIGFKLYLEVAMVVDHCAIMASAASSSSSSSSGKTNTATTTTTSTNKPLYDFQAISYEFLSQALTLYEDDISDSRMQYRCIINMVGTLLALSYHSIKRDDYETLITKTTQHGAKLIKKPDQCKMVTLCSHLFFKGEQNEEGRYHNPQRVLECLQRALKIADVCTSSSSSSSSSSSFSSDSKNLQLFIQVLDHYVYYYTKQNPVITNRYVSGLIALINEHVDNSRDYSDGSVQAQAYYRQILNHVKRKQKKELEEEEGGEEDGEGEDDEEGKEGVEEGGRGKKKKKKKKKKKNYRFASIVC